MKAKPWLKPDGKPKRGRTKKGEVSKKTLTNRLDALARKDCHKRNKCEAKDWEKFDPPLTTKGECSGGLEWCHILSRRHKKIRWSPLNCLSLCSSCHSYFTDHSAEFGLFVEHILPGRLEYLGKLDRDTPYIDYEYWENYYKGKL